MTASVKGVHIQKDILHRTESQLSICIFLSVQQTCSPAEVTFVMTSTLITLQALHGCWQACSNDWMIRVIVLKSTALGCTLIKTHSVSHENIASCILQV